MRFKTILKQINLLNLLLMGIIAALSVYILPSAFNLKVNYTLPAPKTVAEDQEVKAMPMQMPSIAEYAIIAEQNIFHSERKIPAETKDGQQLPKPEFMLYGTLITGDTKIAYLEDLKAPYNTSGRGKRQKALRFGNTLSGYTVNDIQHDRVVMVRDEDRIEVKLLHNKKRSTATETSTPAQTHPAKPFSPPTLKDKPFGAGRPPGVVHEGPLPADIQAPSKEELSKVKDAFGSVIKEKLGREQKQTK